MKNYVLKGITLMIPFFIYGCGSLDNISTSSSNQSPMESIPRIIKNNSDINSGSCNNHMPSPEGKRAFIGIEVNNDLQVVGYFYCGKESPAKEAGILIGETILKIKGCKTNSVQDIQYQIDQVAAGEIVFIEVKDKNSNEIRSIPVSTIKHIPYGINRPGRNQFSNNCNPVK